MSPASRTTCTHVVIAPVIPILIVTFFAPACPPAYCQTGANQTELGKTRSLAESQHEIVVILLGKKQFDQALVEANKIFLMNWPADQEPLLLKELLRLSDRFMHSGQTAMGIKLLEGNQKSFKSRASQASIWKEKGYLLKSMGKSDQALECFREAQRLEK